MKTTSPNIERRIILELLGAIEENKGDIGLSIDKFFAKYNNNSNTDSLTLASLWLRTDFDKLKVDDIWNNLYKASGMKEMLEKLDVASKLSLDRLDKATKTLMNAKRKFCESLNVVDEQLGNFTPPPFGKNPIFPNFDLDVLKDFKIESDFHRKLEIRRESAAKAILEGHANLPASFVALERAFVELENAVMLRAESEKEVESQENRRSGIHNKSSGLVSEAGNEIRRALRPCTFLILSTLVENAH